MASDGKPLAILDVDEFLLEFMRPFLDYYNSIAPGRNFRKEDIWTYNLWEVLGGNKQESVEEVFRFYRTSRCAQLPAYEGAKKLIDTLRQKYRLGALTFRPEWTKGITKNNLEMHFQNSFDFIECTNHFVPNEVKIKTKAEICYELGAAFIGEDSLNNALECAKIGIPVFLLEQPWNLKMPNPLPGNITPIKSLNEMLEIAMKQDI